MASDLVGQRLGDFEIIHELGRGGMGVVYEAVQTSLGRRVALKVLGPGLGLTPKAVDRFRREAAAAAKLHHTNIVPVYTTGGENGFHFYGMELIDGPALDAIIRQMREQSKRTSAPVVSDDLMETVAYTPSDPLTKSSGIHSETGSSVDRFDQIASKIADVADALHHAHQNGVTHRDIKPSNLLLSSDGRLSITDFGVARMLEEPGMTMSGEFVGTPAYMSPEQITAGRIPVDHRTDVYSLGATLYELLTLRPPFSADGRDRMLAMVLQKEPTPPRAVNSKVPRDLETICLKCLEKDPDRRYADAKELATDLRRFVNRFAIMAKRTGPLGRLKKWGKRNPWISGLAAAVLLAVVAAGFFAWRAHEAEQRRSVEKQKQEQEFQAEKRAAALEKALLLALGGDLDGAERLIGEAELLGASAGDVRLMRGQIAYYRGDFSTAIEHLDQAVRLQPGRVAPHALLAAACGDFGLFERYYELMLALPKLQIVSYEDYLFSGLAESFEKPDRGLVAIDEALRRRDSSVARALRARARSLAAMGNGNPADAELAVEDARIAVAMLPDNPFALAQSVMANLIAAGTYQQLGRTEEQKSALSRAGREVQALEKLSHVPAAAVARLFYFRETGDHDASLAEALNRSRSGIRLSDLDEIYLALELYEHQEFQPAIDVLDKSIARGGNTYLKQIFRCFVLAELPDGPARARAAVPELNASNVFAVYVPAIFQLLGLRAEALAAYQSLGQKFLDSNPRSEWVIRLLEFGSGQISVERLMAAAGSTRLNRCEANFLIGMSRLADGDRNGARVHFQDAVNTHVIWYVDHTLSRAFLSRLDADPNWPPWIPQRTSMPGSKFAPKSQ
ncbi:MAG TPA: protein kinase [Phycisphaerae bacterium]